MPYPWSSGDQLNASDLNARSCPPGVVFPYAGRSVPSSDWLKCDGAAVSRTTYAGLFAAVAPSLGTFTVTIASPGDFTLNGHGLVAGDAVYLTTTGALPTGLSQNTIYYVISAGLTANNFELSTSRGGSAINTSVSQSGTHTLRYCPFGLGDGSTTFNVPDLTQRIPAGYKSADADMGYIGQSGGEKTHVLTTAEIPSHNHSVAVSGQWASGGSGSTNVGAVGSISTGNTGGDGAHNNLQPYLTLLYIITVRLNQSYGFFRTINAHAPAKRS
jgi:microcystin-dependent protein